MSDILIKGMEMPTGCASCKIKRRNGSRMVCPLCDEEWDIHDPMSADHRLDYCPLVPVPPHGRLGDLDALAQQIEHERFHHTHTNGLAARHHVAEYGHFLKAISDAPTVIEAEEAQ